MSETSEKDYDELLSAYLECRRKMGTAEARIKELERHIFAAREAIQQAPEYWQIICATLIDEFERGLEAH